MTGRVRDDPWWIIVLVMCAIGAVIAGPALAYHLNDSSWLGLMLFGIIFI